MAEVNYNDGVPQERPQVGAPDDYLHVRATPEAFGAGVAQGLEAFGAGASHAGKFFGQVVTDDQTNQLFDRWNKRLRGDPNQMMPGPDGQMQPDTGYMGLKGRAALDARPGFEQGLDEDLKEIRSNLASPEQQHQFDQASRRYRQHVVELAGSHATGQANVFAGEVNKAEVNRATTFIANNAENETEARNGEADLIRAFVKDAQLRGGGPELLQQALSDARRLALKTRTEAIAVKDPAEAMSILEANRTLAGTQYDELANKFRARKEQQVGDTVADKTIADTYLTMPPASQVLPVLNNIGAQYGISGNFLASVQQLESGNNPNQTSSTGAKGPLQFVGSTAKQYGLVNPFDYGKSADAAARLAADNKAALTARLGRPPTDAELYLAHQQGAGGAAKLLANPNVRAGDLVGDQAIRVNGGDPNAPASAFTSMWTVKFAGAGNMSYAERKAMAYRGIESNPALNANERRHAEVRVNQTIASNQIAMEATKAAEKAASDGAADSYIQRMLKGDYPTPQEIANDPRFGTDWHTRKTIGEMAEKTAEEGAQGATKHYGTGFWQAYQAILAEPDAPDRISDKSQLFARAKPGGDLTLAGVQKLSGVMDSSRKSVDDKAVHAAKVGLINYAKSKLSFDQEFMFPGAPPLRDPKGQQIFNARFIPQFEAAFDQWVKAGKNPWEFLTEENVDKLTAGMRSKSEMAAARLKETGETGDKSAAEPPPPQGIDAKMWAGLMKQEMPMTASGEPMSRRAFANKIGQLLANPTPEMIAAFDSSRFGKIGLSGAAIVKNLTGKPVAGAAEVAPTVKPAVQAEPERASSILSEKLPPDTAEYNAARARARADMAKRAAERETLAQ